MQEHRHHLREVFSRLHNAGLTINMGKSKFYKENLDFLGFNISRAGLRPNHKHTEALRTYPAPQNKEDIARFTRLVNFFKSCIQKAAQLMQPLTDLMRKSDVFRWGESQDKAFQDTKQALVNATTLQHPSATAEVQLAAVPGVKKFRHFVEGRPFTLKSDHKPLILSLLREKQADSPRQQRVLSYLTEVTDNFIYLQGPGTTSSRIHSRQQLTNTKTGLTGFQASC